MAYFNDNPGVLGGMLPPPHDGVRVQISLHESNRILLRYSGAEAALLAAGAIDERAAMSTSPPDSPDSDEPERDRRGRPLTRECLPDGTIRVTRLLPNVKAGVDLPGMSAPAVAQLEVSRSKRTRLRLVVNNSDEH